jgi:site-specific recombinase XerD
MADAAPTTANRTRPRRQPDAAYRQREYLTESEVERLIEATRKRGRNGSRDAAAILLAYRHGLRAQELCSLRLGSDRPAQWSPARQSGQGGLRVCIPCMGRSLERYHRCRARALTSQFTERSALYRASA